MPPKKRKTSDSPETDGNDLTANQTTAAPPTGEKRKRGRPRKYPESATPKPPPGPKRGRGRPRKDESAKVTTPKPATPKEGKRPVGRPRKYPLPNGADQRATKSTSVEAKEHSEEEGENHDYDDDDDDDSGRSYWLMKAEPESRLEKGVDVKFSIDDLRAAQEPEPWDGIRNPVARRHLRDMKKGDLAFFYHSNCKVPGIVGIMEIVQEHSPDESALDPSNPYYDEKSTKEDPKWDVVHVEFRQKFPTIITLNDLKAQSAPGKPLENLQTLKQTRLSVSSVTRAQWKFIMRLAKEKEGAGLRQSTSGDDEESEESSEQ